MKNLIDFFDILYELNYEYSEEWNRIVKSFNLDKREKRCIEKDIKENKINKVYFTNSGYSIMFNFPIGILEVFDVVNSSNNRYEIDRLPFHISSFLKVSGVKGIFGISVLLDNKEVIIRDGESKKAGTNYVLKYSVSDAMFKIKYFKIYSGKSVRVSNNYTQNADISMENLNLQIKGDGSFVVLEGCLIGSGEKESGEIYKGLPLPLGNIVSEFKKGKRSAYYHTLKVFSKIKETRNGLQFELAEPENLGDFLKGNTSNKRVVYDKKSLCKTVFIDDRFEVKACLSRKVVGFFKILSKI